MYSHPRRIGYGHNRHYTSFSVGFGFYRDCIAFPEVYPAYYPVYTQPVYVEEPVYVETPVYVPVDPAIVSAGGTSSAFVAPSSGYEQGGGSLGIAPEELQELMAEGTQLFWDGQYDEAARLFLRVAMEDPNNVDAHFAYASARFATGDYNVAAVATRKGVKLFPEIVDSMFDIRDRYGDATHFEHHLRRLEERVREWPDDLDARIVLGFVAHFSGAREWAAETFRWVLSRSQADADLAMIFLNAKTPDEIRRMTGPSAAQSSAPASAVVRPTVQPRVVRPTTPAVLFHGTISRDHDVAPKSLITVDGIAVKVEDTDDGPVDADLDISLGHSKAEYEDLRVGAHLELVGYSGQRYRLVIVGIDDNTETVSFLITR